MGRPSTVDPRQTTTSVRMTTAEKAALEARAAQRGFRSVSDYLRSLAKADGAKAERVDELPRTARPVSEFHRTDLGVILNGNSLDWMATADPQSVDLVMTSPPFGLVRKKTYGNEDAHLYCNWFRPLRRDSPEYLRPEEVWSSTLGAHGSPASRPEAYIIFSY